MKGEKNFQVNGIFGSCPPYSLKDKKILTNNYREISVMPSVARTFSTLIKDKTAQHMDNYSEVPSGK